MKKYVYIQSQKTIVVTSNLSFNDLTKYDSDIKDRLKIQATMVSCTIHAGRHSYPAIVKDWKTVKALQADGILTVGEETDDAPISVTSDSTDAPAKPVEEAPTAGKKVKVVESLDDISK